MNWWIVGGIGLLLLLIAIWDALRPNPRKRPLDTTFYPGEGLDKQGDE